MFCKTGVLRNFAKLPGKHLCQSFFFNKVAGLSPATLLKKRLWHRCFLVNLAKFQRTPFFTTPPLAASVNCKTFEHVCSMIELYFVSFINIFVQTGNAIVEMKETEDSKSQKSSQKVTVENDNLEI